MGDAIRTRKYGCELYNTIIQDKFLRKREGVQLEHPLFFYLDTIRVEHEKVNGNLFDAAEKRGGKNQKESNIKEFNSTFVIYSKKSKAK